MDDRRRPQREGGEEIEIKILTILNGLDKFSLRVGRQV